MSYFFSRLLKKYLVYGKRNLAGTVWGGRKNTMLMNSNEYLHIVESIK